MPIMRAPPFNRSLTRTLKKEQIMPRFYFHVSAAGQDFKDDVGSDASDLAAVHSRALQLADRVMMYSIFADRTPDFRRWMVKVRDEAQRPVIDVLFPTRYEPGKSKPVSGYDARTLLQALDVKVKGASWRRRSVA
jgi:Domain of unknown function (DUF6894)